MRKKDRFRFCMANGRRIKWMNLQHQNLQSTTSIESNLVIDGLRKCICCGDNFADDVEPLAKSTVSMDTFSPVLPLKYSVVDVSMDGNWILLFARDKCRTVLVTVVIDECLLQIPAPCFQTTQRIVWTRTGLRNEFSYKLRFHSCWIGWSFDIPSSFICCLNYLCDSNAPKEIILKWNWTERARNCIKFMFVLSYVFALWYKLIANGGVENE